MPVGSGAEFPQAGEAALWDTQGLSVSSATLVFPCPPVLLPTPSVRSCRGLKHSPSWSKQRACCAGCGSAPPSRKAPGHFCCCLETWHCPTGAPTCSPPAPVTEEAQCFSHLSDSLAEPSSLGRRKEQQTDPHGPRPFPTHGKATSDTSGSANAGFLV